jgi:hypothetical protein
MRATQPLCWPSAPTATMTCSPEPPAAPSLQLLRMLIRPADSDEGTGSGSWRSRLAVSPSSKAALSVCPWLGAESCNQLSGSCPRGSTRCKLACLWPRRRGEIGRAQPRKIAPRREANKNGEIGALFGVRLCRINVFDLLNENVNILYFLHSVSFHCHECGSVGVAISGRTRRLQKNSGVLASQHACERSFASFYSYFVKHDDNQKSY